jgi:hypothetical protein
LSTGPDPGQDQLASTADDLEIVPTMSEARRQGICPVYLWLGNDRKPSLLDTWRCWTGIGGGHAFPALAGEVTPAVTRAVRDQLLACWGACRTLTVRPEAAFAAWVTSVIPPSYGDLVEPAIAFFDLDVGPPPGTPSGTYDFTVDFVCDGVTRATQAVTIVVAPCVSPAGRIGNHLLAVRSGDDVDLDWRSQPLTERRYNVHRERSKADLPTLPSLVLRSAYGDELYRDPAVVPPGPGTLFFYQVFGRDCSGDSVFN